jgi:phosphate transport system permease protein
VLLADFTAGSVIRGGGIFVLVAVLGICVFLFAVFLPLFGSAKVGEPISYRLPRGGDGLLFAELNEYRSLGAAFHRDGMLVVFDGRTGQKIREEKALPEGALVASFSRNAGAKHVGLGLADGTLVLGRLEFTSRFLEDAADGGPPPLEIGQSAPFEGGIVERTPIGQLRKSDVLLELNDPVPLGEGGSAVTLLSYRASDDSEVAAGLSAGGKLVFSQITKKENMLTGKTSVRLKKHEIPHEGASSPPESPTDPAPESPTDPAPESPTDPAPQRPHPAPSYLLLNARGDQLFVAWAGGQVHRFDLRDPEHPVLAEKLDVTAGETRLTALQFMLGDQSILAGDSDGGCTAWFLLPDEGQEAGSDGYRMKAAHVLERQDSAIISLGISRRDKSFATGTNGGGVWLRHMTSERVLANVRGSRAAGGGEAEAASGPAAPIIALQITPKADGILAVDAAGNALVWPLSNPHPETTLGTIFGKVWYEGHEEPVHSWQSSSGTDDFEPKLGLIPLIFGTLKATFYALLFAVPVAILAAIYTSEFLSPRVRAAVKPSIEMMASLPSVVLGFLAALVLAPWAENWVLSLLIVFLVVPCAVVFAAYAWLFLPEWLSATLDGLPKLAISGVVFILAIAAAFQIGPMIEEAFFLGDFRSWLAAPGRGTPAAFWAGLLFPLALAAVYLAHRIRARRRTAAHRPGSGFGDALRQLVRGTAILAAALALSAAAGLLLTALGFDPRGSLVGTYVQRNTMIVGFVMGFAVIPIIYTIAEDALSSVPQHLRGAALGCGATPWQAAVMVILPTAMSGIFSAVMVGLGRAVGETMIVVMAAGNTPILDVNLFNGLRALSATIAVELPEAVKDGTLYRMLFLAAATLFVMTFTVNTIAEVIRMRFRKRAFEL